VATSGTCHCLQNAVVKPSSTGLGRPRRVPRVLAVSASSAIPVLLAAASGRCRPCPVVEALHVVWLQLQPGAEQRVPLVVDPERDRLNEKETQ